MRVKAQRRTVFARFLLYSRWVPKVVTLAMTSCITQISSDVLRRTKSRSENPTMSVSPVALNVITAIRVLGVGRAIAMPPITRRPRKQRTEIAVVSRPGRHLSSGSIILTTCPCRRITLHRVFFTRSPRLVARRGKRGSIIKISALQVKPKIPKSRKMKCYWAKHGIQLHDMGRDGKTLSFEGT